MEGAAAATVDDQTVDHRTWNGEITFEVGELSQGPGEQQARKLIAATCSGPK